ncbi:hypothetical protein K2173_027930 [Erythroxylum novogranatense]|uniref:ZF-HD dimerization-type domain-containing protein n=1 Tax=Erythroxylum novogranatense TaxID=1862640 RepID=A0AAV8U0N8_9ROSI|nr:hypothetical protein K2173_027930 [Erythroxylum novogranatense]
MELRSPENDVRTSVYGHQSSGVERRKEGNNNGTTTVSQTLDHHHRQVGSLGQGRSLNPDRSAPVSGGTNTKQVANVRYRECLRNHAASIGGNVFDGCGEFMPAGDDGTLEALKCAACECHRNFHRKEVDGETTQFSPNSRQSSVIHSLQLPLPLPSPTMLHHHPHHRYSMGLHTHPTTPPNMVQPMSVAFGGGSGGTESSSEDLNPMEGMGSAAAPPPPPYLLSKKRFRTKFTADQKDKMMEFAEKVGWRINKQDEEEVDKFCAEVGVRRQVFKVWMHNNKNLKKQPQLQNPPFEGTNLSSMEQKCGDSGN